MQMLLAPCLAGASCDFQDDEPAQYILIELSKSDASLPKSDFTVEMSWTTDEPEEYTAFIQEKENKWKITVEGDPVSICDIDVYPIIKDFKAEGPDSCDYRGPEHVAWYRFKVTSDVLHGLKVEPGGAPVGLSTSFKLPEMPAERCLTKVDWRRPPRRPPDRQLAAEVGRVLSRDPEIASFDIEVRADHGVVELHGAVKPDLKSRIESLIETVEGVQDVHSDDLTEDSPFVGTSRLNLDRPSLQLTVGGLPYKLPLQEKDRVEDGTWVIERARLEEIIGETGSSRGRGQDQKERIRQQLGNLQRMIVQRVTR